MQQSTFTRLMSVATGICLISAAIAYHLCESKWIWLIPFFIGLPAFFLRQISRYLE